jgi:hypothetical protein
MLYINQNDYEHIHYEHNLDNGGVAPEKQNIKTAGCGLCCITMVINHLTVKRFGLRDAVRIAGKTGANRVHGSRMRVMAPYIAEKYGLDYKKTNSLSKAVSCLKRGGEVIALVRGDRDGKNGLFTHIGHYITLISYDGEYFCILDPGMKDGKFDDAIKDGTVRLEYPCVYCRAEVIEEEADKSVAAYYLFERKKPEDRR